MWTKFGNCAEWNVHTCEARIELNMAFIAQNIVIFMVFLLAFFFYRGTTNHIESFDGEATEKHKAII